MMSWCITSWGNEISKRRGRSGCQRFCRSRVTTGRQEADLWSLPWVKVDGSFRFIQGTLFRSLRIAALRVLSLPRFLEVFQSSKMRDDKTKEVKSAHFWMLIGSCCQPYQNLPIKIFINHPDARLGVFAGFVHLHFSTFVVFFLQANCHKCYRSCKLRSRCTVSTAVIVWRTSKKSFIQVMFISRCGAEEGSGVSCWQKKLFFKNGIAWKFETYLCIWWSLGPIAGLGWTESGLPRHAAVTAPQLPCGRHDKEIFWDANTCKLNG